jgi:hypothetical protein
VVARNRRGGGEKKKSQNNKHTCYQKCNKMCCFELINDTSMKRHFFFSLPPPTLQIFFVLPEEGTQNGIDFKKGVYTSLQLSQRFTFAYPKKDRERCYLCVLITSTDAKKLVVLSAHNPESVARIPSSELFIV